MLDVDKQDISLEGLHEKVEAITQERDTYKKLYIQTLELCKKLEAGILPQKRERFAAPDGQLTLSVLGTLLRGGTTEAPVPAAVKEHVRAKPTGRAPFPEKLPRVDIEVLPPEVIEKGLAAFERIGEDVTETVERRPASLVVVRIHKPKFVFLDRGRLEDTKVMQAPTPELPIERGMAGPALLADTIVRRWQDHLPLHRLEKIYGRDGLELPRSTVCGWHARLSELVSPLVEAMKKDAFLSPYLCTDATGVLVQNKDKCRNGHFWVLVAPDKHILFTYTPKHDGAAVDEFLKGYKGYLVSDAHSVYNHLFESGDVIECGCWAHCRRYFFKSLGSDEVRAKHALTLIGNIFAFERTFLPMSPAQRLEMRGIHSKPLVDEFFEWCAAELPNALDETPISKAIGYATNQKEAFRRFLENGLLPIHNNFSERELRREAVGRKNWLFLGTDDAGEVNANFVSLLASCQLHGIEPAGYLRDLFCLLPSWNHKRVLELAPAYWRKTLEYEETQQRLAANVFRKVSLGLLEGHPALK